MTSIPLNYESGSCVAICIVILHPFVGARRYD